MTEKFENTYVYYTRVAEPKKAMDEGKPDYFSTSLLVTKAQKKAFAARFPKNKIKEYSAEEFETIFKVAPPDDFLTADDEVFVLELKKKAVYADGNPLKPEHRPKVFMKVGNKIVDDTSTLLGNGTLASVSWSQYEVKAGKFPGVYPQLNNILVHTLVPYVGKDMSAAGSEFGEVEGNGSEFKPSPAAAPASAQKAPAAPVPKAAPKKARKPDAEDDFEQDDLPFS